MTAINPCRYKDGYIGDTVFKHKILSKEEEYDLVRRAQNGIDLSGAESARNRLLLCNMKFIHTRCQKWANADKGVTADELLCDGIVGFLEGIERFDVRKGLRLCTYAGYWVNKQLSFSDLLKPLIRLPSEHENNLRVINKAKARLMQQGILNPTAEQLANECGLSEKAVIGSLDAYSDIISIHNPLDNDDGILVSDILPDNSADDATKQQDLRMDAAYFLGLLPVCHRIILSRYYGIPEKLSLAEMARQLGLSRERVSKIMTDGLSALQRHAQALSHSNSKEYIAAVKATTVEDLLKHGMRISENLFIDESDALHPFKQKADIAKQKPSVPSVKEIDDYKTNKPSLPFDIEPKKPIPNPFKQEPNGNGNGNGNSKKKANGFEQVEIPWLVNGASVFVNKETNGAVTNGNHNKVKEKVINTPFGAKVVAAQRDIEPSRKSRRKSKDAERRRRRKGIDSVTRKPTMNKRTVQLSLFEA